MSAEPRNITDLVNDLSPPFVGSVSMGGSRVLVPSDERAAGVHAGLVTLTHVLGPDLEHVVVRPVLEPEPPPLPDQFGPFSFSPIVFDGPPVGGWAQLTLFRSGNANFSGHFHDSGAPSYDTACVFVVKGADNTAYTFSHTGRVHGTFEAGSRDDNWGENRANPSLVDGWPHLAESLTWHANAAVNIDIGPFVDDAVKAVGAVAAVIAII